jgi:hypothetical protein
MRKYGFLKLPQYKQHFPGRHNVTCSWFSKLIGAYLCIFIDALLYFLFLITPQFILFVVGIATGLLNGRFGVRNPTRTNNFSLFKNVQTGSRAHPAPYSVGTGFFPPQDKTTWS